MELKVFTSDLISSSWVSPEEITSLYKNVKIEHNELTFVINSKVRISALFDFDQQYVFIEEVSLAKL